MKKRKRWSLYEERNREVRKARERENQRNQEARESLKRKEMEHSRKLTNLMLTQDAMEEDEEDPPHDETLDEVLELEINQRKSVGEEN